MRHDDNTAAPDRPIRDNKALPHQQAKRSGLSIFQLKRDAGINDWTREARVGPSRAGPVLARTGQGPIDARGPALRFGAGVGPGGGHP